MAPNLVAVRDARERLIARLSDVFARGDMDLEDFEDRVTLVHRADSVADIEKLAADLPEASTAPAPVKVTALARLDDVRPRGRIVAIFGGAVRQGTWTPQREVGVTAIFGGAVLDFREARMAPGITQVHITSIFGGAQIIVPPNLAVEVNGSAVFGGFEHMERTPGERDPDVPVLVVTGTAVFGGVAVETRLPGESERQARRRRRKERRALRAR